MDIKVPGLLERQEAATSSISVGSMELELPYGMYFLRVTMGKQRKAVKFIVE